MLCCSRIYCASAIRTSRSILSRLSDGLLQYRQLEIGILSQGVDKCFFFPLFVYLIRQYFFLTYKLEDPKSGNVTLVQVITWKVAYSPLVIRVRLGSTVSVCSRVSCDWKVPDTIWHDLASIGKEEWIIAWCLRIGKILTLCHHVSE